MEKNNNNSITRSSVAEYLTFITADGEGGVEAIYADENVWLSQKMMALLYDVEINTINYHIKKLLNDSEINSSTIRNFRIVQTEGSRLVEREVSHYNLKTIIAVGYKVYPEKAVQFRKWATDIIENFTIKGFGLEWNCGAKSQCNFGYCIDTKECSKAVKDERRRTISMVVPLKYILYYEKIGIANFI